MPGVRNRVVRLALTVLAVAVVACGGQDEPAGPTTGSTGAAGATVTGEVTVFAAASLTGAFTEMGEAFEARYPEASIVFNFAGTPTLRTQLEQGARADVFASANAEQMALAESAGVTAGPIIPFARNSLVLIMPADNPAEIEAPADLANDGLKLALANEDVPVGAYTREMLSAVEASGEHGTSFVEDVRANVVSLESNVKQVVAKVELGEVDAGVVYGTDVTAAVAPQLRKLDIPDEYNVISSYPVALVSEASNRDAGQAFIDFLLSETGQTILAEHGFLSAA